MSLLLFTGSVAATGTFTPTTEYFAADLVIQVPSASYTAAGVYLVGMLNSQGVGGNNFTSSAVTLPCYAMTGSTTTPNQTVITAPGLYFYPNVGGLLVSAVVSPSAANTASIAGNVILRR